MTSTKQVVIRALSSMVLMMTVALNGFSTPTAEQKKGSMSNVKATATKKAETSDILSLAASAAFKKNYPASVIKSVRTEMNGSTKVFHVMALEGKRERHLMIQDDGQIVGDREELPLTMLPTSVRDALKKSVPDATIDRAEKVLDGTAAHYMVRIHDKTGKKELLFDESGSPLKMPEAAGQNHNHSPGKTGKT